MKPAACLAAGFFFSSFASSPPRRPLRTAAQPPTALSTTNGLLRKKSAVWVFGEYGMDAGACRENESLLAAGSDGRAKRCTQTHHRRIHGRPINDRNGWSSFRSCFRPAAKRPGIVKPRARNGHETCREFYARFSGFTRKIRTV